MKKLILTIGSAGAGKTTWTNKRCQDRLGTTAVVSLDILRETMFGDRDKKSYFDHLNSPENLTIIKELMVSQVKVLSKSPTIKEVIVCNTNFNLKTVSEWVMLAEQLGMQFCYKVFNKTFDELVVINRDRPKCDRVPISFLKIACEEVPNVVKALRSAHNCTKIA